MPTTERRVGIVGAAVGVDDWEIGLLFVDDASGVFRAQVQSRSRMLQIEIKGKGYRALLEQARHVAGLHVGLLETVTPVWWNPSHG